MNATLRREIDSCIAELRSIVNGLNDVSGEIKSSIDGMNTNKFTNALKTSANKYQQAANKLGRIK